MPLPYQLAVDGFAPDHFLVHAFTGTEAISEAWSFDVVATAPAGDDVQRGALGQRATLIFNLADKQRAFYGIVSAVRLTEVHPVDRAARDHASQAGPRSVYRARHSRDQQFHRRARSLQRWWR